MGYMAKAVQSRPLQMLALASTLIIASAAYSRDANALEGPSTSYNTIQVIKYSPGQAVEKGSDSVSDDGLAIQGGGSGVGSQSGSGSYGRQESADRAEPVTDTYLAQHVYGDDVAEPSEVYLEELAQTSTPVDTYVPDNQCRTDDSLDSLLAGVKTDEKVEMTTEEKYILGGVAIFAILFLGAFGTFAYFDSRKEEQKSRRSSRQDRYTTSPALRDEKRRKREEDEEPSEPKEPSILERDIFEMLSSAYSSWFGGKESSTETSDSTSGASQPDTSTTYVDPEPEPAPDYRGLKRDRGARGIWSRFATPTSEQQPTATVDPEVAARREKERKKKKRRRKRKKGY